MFVNLNFLGLKLKLSGLNPVAAVTILVSFLVIAGALIPYIAFWTIGVLFNYHIPYTFETVFAALVLLLILKSSTD